MRISADEMMAAMSGVSEQLITESMKGSRTVKERFILRISTAVASLALVAAACIFTAMYAKGWGPVTPANTSPTADTEADPVIGIHSHVTTAMLDETEIEIEWTESEDGSIVHAEITSDGGRAVKFADTQGKFYESMMLCVDDLFYAICNVRTGEITDFMREARYDFYNEDNIRTWDTVRDGGGFNIRYMRFDGSGIYFITLAFYAESIYPRDELRALWVYDYNSAELTRASVEWSQLIWIEPKNGSWASSVGDGGCYFVTADWVYDGGFENVRSISDWFPGLDIDCRAKPVTYNYNFAAEITFEGPGGQMITHTLYLPTGELSSGVPETTEWTVTNGKIGGVEITVAWMVQTGAPIQYYVPDSAPEQDKWRLISYAGGGRFVINVTGGEDPGVYLFDVLQNETVFSHLETYLGALNADIGRDVMEISVSYELDWMLVSVNRRLPVNGDPNDVYYVGLYPGADKIISLRDLPEIAALTDQFSDEYPYTVIGGELSDDFYRVPVSLYLYETFDDVLAGNAMAEATFVYYLMDGRTELTDMIFYYPETLHRTDVNVDGCEFTVEWSLNDDGKLSDINIIVHDEERNVSVTDEGRTVDGVVFILDGWYFKVDLRTGEVSQP